MSPIRIAVAVLLLAGCGHTRPDEMSAADHRAEAERHLRAAEQAESRYDPNAKETPPPVPIWRDPWGSTSTTTSGAPTSATPAPSGNPTERYLSAAQLDRAHAAKHEAAANALESALHKECGAHADTHSCPLLQGRVDRVELVSHGVRLYAKSGEDVPAFAQQLRCHLAAADYEGVSPQQPNCLIFFRGVEARIMDEGRAVELHSSDLQVVARMHEAAQQMFRPPAPSPVSER